MRFSNPGKGIPGQPVTFQLIRKLSVWSFACKLRINFSLWDQQIKNRSNRLMSLIKTHKSSFVNKSWWLMACYVYIDNNSTRSTLFCLLRPSAHYFNTFYVFLCLHFFSNAFLSHSHNEIHFRGMSAAVHSVSACLSVSVSVSATLAAWWSTNTWCQCPITRLLHHRRTSTGTN